MSLQDLTKHLFDQIDRIRNAEGEAMAQEIERSKAVADIGKTIISAASVQLDAMKLAAEHCGMTNDRGVVELVGIESSAPKALRGVRHGS